MIPIVLLREAKLGKISTQHFVENICLVRTINSPSQLDIWQLRAVWSPQCPVSPGWSDISSLQYKNKLNIYENFVHNTVTKISNLLQFWDDKVWVTDIKCPKCFGSTILQHFNYRYFGQLDRRLRFLWKKIYIYIYILLCAQVHVLRCCMLKSVIGFTFVNTPSNELLSLQKTALASG